MRLPSREVTEFDSVDDLKATLITLADDYNLCQTILRDLRWPTPPSRMKDIDVIYAREH
jgi:hypothetical protein